MTYNKTIKQPYKKLFKLKTNVKAGPHFFSVANPVTPTTDFSEATVWVSVGVKNGSNDNGVKHPSGII